MRLLDLDITNIRLFGENTQHISFSPEKNVTVVLGNNGCGKSTILDTVAVLASSFISVFPNAPKDKSFSDLDIHVDEQGKLASYLSAEAEFASVDKQTTLGVRRFRKGLEKSPNPKVAELKSYAEGLVERVKQGDKEVELPILAYYGTGRGQIQAPERKRGFQRQYERWDCYKDTLDPATNFKRFFAWFDSMEDEERRMREQLRDFDYKMPILEAVRTAVDRFVGDRYKRPRIEIHPLRFALDEIGEHNEKQRELRLEQFSDGYKIIIAMIADIASRMAEANPYNSNPLDGHGIVMVDEIDLHLHPKWQRVVLRQLHETFHNIQFIVTTHSPVVVIGAMDICQIVLLDGQRIFQPPMEAYSGYDVNLLLLSELFGLSSIRSSQWDTVFEERKQLLLKPELNNEEKQRLNELEQQISELSFGSTLEENNLFQKLQAIADSFNGTYKLAGNA